ncbi:hypothetical protein JMJ55_06410 [Belnapia sp. T6]|uniref:Uncharacterized protein n=1 Tax=Belnapia mucosa TaxID=2804532 RepID=A0ABS1UZR7_9PROT|nr:hypothetical protein [Belnapia mucosa]MBL6454948.1 hypothetical protein [Belnapia mucosa]
MTDRRGLLLPLLVAACGGRPEPVPLPPGPLSYKHLTPLPLNVASIEIGQEPPLAIPGDIGARLSPSAAEAVRVMARDRLIAVGTTGQANFSVTQAQLVQARDSLNCLLACRLEILSSLGSRLGFVEAQSRRAVSGPDANRPNAPEALLRRTMDDLNVEFEFQLRRTLRDWLSATAPNADGGLAAPAPAPVSQEDLPPGPGTAPSRRETLPP